MTKTQIATDMRRTFGRSFITIGEFSKYARIGKDRARSMLSEVEYIPQGRAKTYFVEDIASAMYDRRMA